VPVVGVHIDGLQNVTGSEEQWSTNLADYIRHNDEALMKASEKLLAAYTEELLPCTSFLEFCDVTGIYYLIFFSTNCHGLYFFFSQVYWML
jgi:hypothetical protein